MVAPDSVFDEPRLSGSAALAAIQRLHPLGRSSDDWVLWFEHHGEPRYRAAQVFRWLHQRGELDPDRMTNVDKTTRARLREEGLAWPARVEQVRRSLDGTRKLLLELGDGKRVEAVIIPMTNEQDADASAIDLEGDDEPPSVETRQRVTLCVSTQVGCAMGCVFCASGQAGLQRGLTAAEVIAQALIARQYLDPNEYLRNVVFMGMGEPLHHYQETRRAISLLAEPDGIALGPRRITVSTVGLVSGIRKLGRDFSGKVGLAISLHAPDDTIRRRIMPVNERYGVAELMAALREYPLPKRRRITIEYTLMRGVNDQPEHARKLARLLGGLRAKVNLIPMNPIEKSELGAPPESEVERFRAVLAESRISCSVRKRRGDDVDAACGQLALQARPASLELVPVERLSSGSVGQG